MHDTTLPQTLCLQHLHTCAGCPCCKKHRCWAAVIVLQLLHKPQDPASPLAMQHLFCFSRAAELYMAVLRCSLCSIAQLQQPEIAVHCSNTGNTPAIATSTSCRTLTWHSHSKVCSHARPMLPTHQQHATPPTLRWPQLLRCYDLCVVCGTAAMQQLLLLCTAA
jgi:hypothetical protein